MSILLPFCRRVLPCLVLAFSAATGWSQNLFWDANGTGAGGTPASPTGVGGTGTWSTGTDLWYNYDTASYQTWTNTAGTGIASFAVASGIVTIAPGTSINANQINIRLSGYTIASADSTAFLNMDGTTPTITISLASNPTNVTLGANITGSNGLTITTTAGGANSSVVNLDGNNTFTGGLNVSAAANNITLNLGSDTALGAGAVSLNAPNTVIVRSSADRALGNNISTASHLTFGGGGFDGDLSFGTLTRTAATKNLTVNNTTTVTGFSSGNFSTTKLGAGTLVVNGNWSSSGVTAINAGAVAVSGGYTQGNNGASLGGGGQLGLNGTLTAGINTANSVKWSSSGGLFAYGANGTWGNSANNLTVAFGGLATPTALTWNGNGTTGFVVSGQTLILGHALSNGTLDFRNAINLNGATQTVQVNRGATNTAGGVDAILSGVLSNGGLTKTGDGTLELSADNTYAGTTSVDAGTLLVTGTHTGAGAYTVAGTLGGNGTIITAGNAGVTLAAGGKLSPGSSPGILTLDLGSGVLDLTAGVTPEDTGALIFELGTTSDQIVLSNAASSLNIGAGLLEFDDFNFTAGAGFAAGETYVLIDTSNAITGSLGANLTGTVGGLSATLGTSLDGQDLILTVVPEPGTPMLIGLGLGLITLHLRRRRS